jgi:hypothetical protein
MTPARTALALLLVAAAPLPALAGVAIEGKDDDDTSRILMEGQKLRMESGKEGHAMIFDGATGRSVQLDPEEKTYVEFTKDDLAKMRAMVAQSGRGKDQKPFSVRYEKTGRTDEALGKRCDVYRVVQSADPGDQEEMCIAPFGSFGVAKADFEPLRKFGELMSQMGGGEVDRSWADLPGVPLVTWDLDDGQRKEEFRATKIEKRSIPASEFTVPAGWKKGPGFAEQMKDMEQQMKEQMKQMEEMKKQMGQPEK